MAKKRDSSSSRPSGSSRSSSGQGKLDNVTYNVIAVLHEKSQGLEAYHQYLEDAEDNDEVRELLEEIQQQDQQAVQRLQECLRTLISAEGSEEEEAA